MALGWTEFVAYLGSFLMFSTFWMKRMIPLRVVAIAANCAMISYALSMKLYPVLAAQSMMLPLNLWRLWQMRKLVKKVAASSVGEFGPDALIPFMHKETFRDGETLFEKGDESDKMYLIKEGSVKLEEINVTLGPGDLFGEIGLMAPNNRRTATAVASGDTRALSMTRKDVHQLFFQEPDFGFHLMELVTERLLKNLELSRARAT